MNFLDRMLIGSSSTVRRALAVGQKVLRSNFQSPKPVKPITKIYLFIGMCHINKYSPSRLAEIKYVQVIVADWPWSVIVLGILAENDASCARNKWYMNRVCIFIQVFQGKTVCISFFVLISCKR